MENNKKREMTQEELDMIVGGYIPNTPRMREQQTASGILCPICGSKIPIAIHQLLFDRSLHCPVCGLSLFIDKNKSDKALKILGKVDEAQRLAEQHRG